MRINFTRFLYMGRYIMVLKIFLYLMSIVSTQMVVMRELKDYASKQNLIRPEAVSHKQVILIYDVLIFYFTCIALLVFLIFSRCFSF